MSNEMHSGELTIHRLLGVPGEVTRSMPWSFNRLDPGQQKFFLNISIFVIGTLDAQGRPWASLLAGSPPSFISSPTRASVIVNTEISPYDPLVDNLVNGFIHDGKRLFAGLGLELSERSRSKISGTIEGTPQPPSVSSQKSIRLSVTESQENCPKYINARVVSYHRRSPQLRRRRFGPDNVSIDKACREHIGTCDATFIATRHLGTQGRLSGDAEYSMDVNHRGGNPGFVRCSDDGSTLYFPEYSGNRIYSSLGNIQTDHVAGVVFPSFTTGDVLYVTGEADVISGEEAEKLMPRVKVLVRLRITGHVFVEKGLNVQQQSEVQFSPYNPPVRHLHEELLIMGTAGEELSIGASLVDAHNLAGDIRTYTLSLDKPLSYLPGQYVILDFSGLLHHEYSHMDDRHPQLINDDFIRTFTISSAPPLKNGAFAPSKIIECTVKSTHQGVVSAFLRQQLVTPKPSKGKAQSLLKNTLEISLKGSGGQFTCFDPHGNLTDSRMLWVCAGVGVTPFMAMAEGIERKQFTAEIVMFFSLRNNEVSLTRRFVGKPFISSLSLFISDAPATRAKPLEDWAGAGNTAKWHSRRVSETDFKAIENIELYTVFLCGPPAFMVDMTQYLINCGILLTNIRTESFSY